VSQTVLSKVQAYNHLVKSNIKKALVTGCAGFIGSNLTDSLLASGIEVVGVDNLSTGKIEFLQSAMQDQNFRFHKLDLISEQVIVPLLQDVDIVYHLAANADVRFGANQPRRDLEQNTLVTHNVLESMRNCGVHKIVFASTGSIYGESTLTPTPEDAPFPTQTSLYGASKLACEGLVQAYCETFGMQSWIFRFVSILGPRYSHGHVFDFCKQLKDHPTYLIVLGDGHQRKSYLHVSDCIDAMEIAIKSSVNKVNVFNLGVDGTCEVRDSVKWIVAKLGLDPTVVFGTETRGWIGDNPLIHLATEKIKNFGWEPKYSIKEGIDSTVKYLVENEWLFNNSSQIESR
jgi:UDP-glucose 4-epimerase